MIVKKYLTEIVNIYNPIENVFSLELKSHSGRFKYYPGQFLHLAIDQEYDGTYQWPESRCFSMQSNPEEPNIRVTYSVKGRFTSLMKQKLKPGVKVWLKLPYGNLFTQPHNKTNTVFIAGGTGITPFLSLFMNKTFESYISPKIYLGFRSKAFNVYQDELESIKSSIQNNVNASINIFYEDLHGRLDADEILEKNSKDATFFVSGPPGMIKSFKTSFLSNGVSPHNILTDDWE